MTHILPAGLLTLALAVPAAAQTGAATPVTEPPAQRPPVEVFTPRADASEVRGELFEVLRSYPPGVGQILSIDPTLLDNESFMASYPALATFVARNPEVRRDSEYFFGRFTARGHQNFWEDAAEGIGIFIVFAGITGVFIWLIRTFLDERRATRLQKAQHEVHTRLLERFGSSQELLAYMQTPSGRRFLEAAPIAPGDAPRPAAPIGRILWAVQAGVVLLAGSLALYLVSGRVTPPEAGQPLALFGIVGAGLALGFIASGAVAWVLSARFGLLPSSEVQADRAVV